MNIEETLTVWGALYEKCEAAYQEHLQIKLAMQAALYNNEEPFELLTISGNYTGITLKTPDDVADIITGCVIAIGGAEWFRASGYWLSSFDTKKDDHEMFVRIMRNRKHVHLIHKSY